MSRMLIVFAILLASCTRVMPGYEGILVDTCASNEKDSVKSLKIGRYFEGVCENIYTYPLYKVRYVFTRNPDEGSPDNEEICANDTDGMQHCFDVGITVRTLKGKAPKVYGSFRSYADDMESIVKGPLYDILRDSFNQVVRHYKAQEVYASKKGEIRDKIKEMFRNRINPDGIEVDEITLNSYRPPRSVVKAIESKVRVDEEAAQARAESFKIKAEEEKKTITEEETAKRSKIKADADVYVKLQRAKAEAESNKMITQSLTRELIEYEKVRRWNGQNPKVVSGNNGTLVKVE